MSTYLVRGGAVHGSVGGSLVSMAWNGDPGDGLLTFHTRYPDADDAEWVELVFEIEYEEDPEDLWSPMRRGSG